MKKFRKLFAILLASVMLLSACSKPAEKAGEKTGEKTAEAKFKAGEYQASAKGYKGDVKFKVTFTDAKIEKIEVVESNETPDIGGKAIETLSAKVIESQSLAVDAVSGATLSSTAFATALADAVKQAGGNVEELSKKAEETPKKAVNLETDVIVIGGGGAGLSASISAAQAGAKVILIEKTGALGGNTIRAGGPYNAVDPERQKSVPVADEASMAKVLALTTKEAVNERHKALMEELKKDLDAYNAGEKKSLFDSKALHKLQTYDGGDYTGNLALIEKLIDESLDTSVWMSENGVEWKNDITTVPGGLWPRAHLPKGSAGGDYIKAGEAKAKELGVTIMLNSPATELIIEGGKVVGVKGTSEGAEMTIKAKAVVLATGGFAANVDMRSEYNPALIKTLPTTNSPAITGDGITMAKATNANLVGMEFIQSLPLGNPENGALNGWMGGSGVEYYYQINKEGKRFMAEDGRRDYMTKSLLEQTDAFSYVITSGNNELEVNDKNTNIWGDNVEELVKAGKVFKADTIEDLAKQINIDPAVLKETHDKFNSYVANGKDEEFGRTLFGKPLDKAPYYASPRVPTVHHTMGGVEIDLECQVLGKDGKPIPGLFAAGEVTGGIHGKNRLGGNALVDIHVFGRTAGTNAAKAAK